jgi:hypothetical protein
MMMTHTCVDRQMAATTSTAIPSNGSSSQASITATTKAISGGGAASSEVRAPSNVLPLLSMCIDHAATELWHFNQTALVTLMLPTITGRPFIAYR